MASEEDQPIYNDDDFDDDDDDNDNDSEGEEEEEEEGEPLNGAVPDVEDSDSSSEEDPEDSTTAPLPPGDSTAVTVAAIPQPSSSSAISLPSVTLPPQQHQPPSSTSAVTIALPDPKRQRFDPTTTTSSSLHQSPPIVTPEKKPPAIDDSRRLFQRLWTDEDEIELLQGFLDYTSTRGTNSSGHHHDTAAFYDQIKSKLQLDFNKNQLVEKLRRLKKKYRNVLSKMSSGKDFVFKSPHDQATFELSRKIWSNLSSANYRGVSEFDDEDGSQNPNPNSGSGNLMIAAATPPRPPNSSYVISHINLNNSASTNPTPTPMVVDYKAGSSGYNASSNNNINNISSSNNAVGFDIMMSNMHSPAAKLSTRKRPRVKVEDHKFVRNVNLGGNVGGESANVNVNDFNNINSNSNVSGSNNVNLGSTMQGLIEEAVRSCLSPMVKDLVNNAVNGTGFGGVSGGAGAGAGGGSSIGGVKGVGALAMNAVPFNFSGVNLAGNSGGDVMDEKWRQQQILELEVYSKRLELVQDQIKLSLEELRSLGS